MATPIPPAAVEAVKGVLVDGFRELVGNARGGAARAVDTGGFIAGPEPANPILAWQHRTGRAVCDRWARGPRDEILPGDDLVLRAACEEYLGPDNPGPPSTAPPFVGGQCPGAPYLLTITHTLWDGPPDSVNTFDIVGPVGAARFTNPFGGANLRNGRPYENIVVDYGNGQSTSPVGSAFGTILVSLTVQRTDGQPDNCGSLPPEFDAGDRNPNPEPNPGPVGGPTGYPFPDFDVRIGPGGDIIFDFGDGSPEVPIDPSDPFGGDDGGGGGGGGNSPPPGDQGTAGGTQGTGPAGESDGEAPEGQVLVGLKMDLVGIPPQRYLLAPGVYRGGAYIYMGGEVALDQDFAGSTLADGQFVYAEKDNLTKWRVKSNSGFNWSVTPYYREVT